MGVLYRDVGGYPEPTRSQLQRNLREYLEYVIHQAWPLQQRGQIPAGGVEQQNRFQALLLSFEPTTEGQKLLHAETLRAYDQMIEARRLRLDVVLTGLPGILWCVIVIGALAMQMASHTSRTPVRKKARPHAAAFVLGRVATYGVIARMRLPIANGRSTRRSIARHEPQPWNPHNPRKALQRAKQVADAEHNPTIARCGCCAAV